MKDFCNACHGEGVIVESILVARCCMRSTKYGECCGDPVPEEELVPYPCPYCMSEKEDVNEEKTLV